MVFFWREFYVFSVFWYASKSFIFGHCALCTLVPLCNVAFEILPASHETTSGSPVSGSKCPDLFIIGLGGISTISGLFPFKNPLGVLVPRSSPHAR